MTARTGNGKNEQRQKRATAKTSNGKNEQRQIQEQQQIPFGDDNKKSKCKSNGKCGGLSTARFTMRL
jgi:hypothetical protein